MEDTSIQRMKTVLINCQSTKPEESRKISMNDK
jgi:hypothetical protein